jgi:hypothetical protein
LGVREARAVTIERKGLQMVDGTERAKALISSRLDEIKEEGAGLERALKALGPEGRAPRRAGRRSGGKARSRSAGSGSQSGSTSSQPSRKRAAAGTRGEELLAAIKAKPGAGAAELAATIGIRPTQVYGLVAKARAERLIVRDGAGYKLKGS